MILVRSDSSGAIFLVREGEEPKAFESLREFYPGAPVELIQHAAGLLLVRVAPEGAHASVANLAIGRVELSARKS